MMLFPAPIYFSFQLKEPNGSNDCRIKFFKCVLPRVCDTLGLVLSLIFPCFLLLYSRLLLFPSPRMFFPLFTTSHIYSPTTRFSILPPISHLSIFLAILGYICVRLGRTHGLFRSFHDRHEIYRCLEVNPIDTSVAVPLQLQGRTYLQPGGRYLASNSLAQPVWSHHELNIWVYLPASAAVPTSRGR